MITYILIAIIVLAVGVAVYLLFFRRSKSAPHSTNEYFESLSVGGGIRKGMLK